MGAIERSRPGYSEQQVKEILAQAMDLPDQQGETFSREQMLQLAEELGISEAQVDAAEREWRSQNREQQLVKQQKTFIASRRREMRNSVAGYAIMGGLLYLASISGIGVLTAVSGFLLIPMAIIAVVIFFGLWEAVFDVEGEDFDKEFAKWQERREKQFARLQPPRPITPGGHLTSESGASSEPTT